jgi:hypothetical protein
MFATHIEASPNTSRGHLERKLQALAVTRPRCLLTYADVQTPIQALAAALATAFPGVPSFGCTSFLGVCTPDGFKRGVGILAFEEEDAIDVTATLITCNEHTARSHAERAAAHLEQQLGGPPHLILMHATPGFEEQLLEGLHSRLGAIPVFGGSAADDSIAGQWSVFCNGRATSHGAVFAGLRSDRRMAGGFIGGYLPSEHRGIVTRAEGRIVHEIDRKPAARVYNEWTNGAIAAKLATGGRVLSETNLLPLARDVEVSGAMPRRLLAHPESVIATTGSLEFFSRFRTGDPVLLMTNTKPGLIPRMRRAAERAIEGHAAPRGGLLVYCAGCLSSTPEDGASIGKQFRQVAGDVPFVGISTFGEQGPFFTKGSNYHGNLMCSAVVFG